MIAKDKFRIAARNRTGAVDAPRKLSESRLRRDLDILNALHLVALSNNGNVTRNAFIVHD